MRRTDREVTKKEDLLTILQGCTVCRLALAVDNRPYVVPLNFGYTWEENEPLRLYFHSAPEGKKLDMLAENDLACFEMDGEYTLLSGESACKYSFAYASLIGWGQVRIITEAEEKRHGLHKLMEHQAGPGNYTFSEADIARVTVFCLTADEMTGKRNTTQTA